MPEVVEDFNWVRQAGPGRNRKYPWDEWCDGRVWKLTRGVDFEIPVESMRASFIQHCMRTGLGRRTTSPEPDVLMVQAVPKRV